MSDLHLNFGAQPHERPDTDDVREARHQVLATLLGAYADGELPAETASQIDAHLLGCARCRRGKWLVQTQQAPGHRRQGPQCVFSSANISTFDC